MLSFSRTLRYLAMTCAVPALLATPAAADPAVGIGFSMSFGRGQTETGMGLRVFSNDRRDKAVGSVGVDYMFGSKRWRGTVGAAYLGRNAYVGLDLGFDFKDGGIDFGPSVGAVRTKAPPAAPTTPPIGDSIGDYE
jgi:hypothetical protein